MGFRRRRFPRFHLLRRRRPRPAEIRVRREIRFAHELGERGQYLESAAAFERLANSAKKRGLPQYSQLLIQAGRARITGGDQEAGTDQIKTAIIALLDTGRLERVARLRPRLEAFFISHRLDDEWQQILKLLGQAMMTTPAPSPVENRRLPPKCPYCGATIIPEELEEVNSQDAICGYCGSLVQADQAT